VLVIIDTLRADHLGIYGYDRRTSPALDAWAAQGTVFERAYSHSPWTLPSVASIFTGLEPLDHGVTQWQDRLSPELLTLAEVLQQQGYSTQAAVSHFVLSDDKHFDQGFSVYDLGAMDRGSPHDVRSSDYISDWALELLQPPLQEPFFLALHYFDPHWAYLVHEGFDFGDEPQDRYDSEVAFTDHHLGRVLAQLDLMELTERSLVTVIGDHGEEFGDHGRTQHTVALYEEVIRIPFALRVPGFQPERIQHVVTETQLAPTLLALAGLPIPPSFHQPPIPFDKKGFAPQEDQLVVAETLRKADMRAVIDGDWKLIHDRKRRRTELFDLGADPCELDDQRHQRKDLRQSMQGLLTEIYKQERVPVRSEPLSTETEQSLKALGYLGD